MRRVHVYVDQPSCIELHVRETVRLDRLTPTADGYVAEPYGALLAPGSTQVPLEVGLYHLRTLDDAQLRVLAGGVQVASPSPSGKGGWPDPSMNTASVATSALGAVVAEKGYGPCGHVPALRVTYAMESAL
jgi:hypothetical protein